MQIKNIFIPYNFAAKSKYFLLRLTLLLAIFSSCHKDLNDRLVTQPISDNTKSHRKDMNVILILGDDIGYEIPTCDGGNSYSTPNIDQLAASGMRFTQCYSSPLCSPSRFMLITGKYNYRNYTQWGVMDLSEKTIANMFNDAGYNTCVAGKWQFDGGNISIKNFGFKNYCVFNAFENPGKRYKDPDIYVNGDYLPKTLTAGKYGEDFFADYVMDFMDSGTKKTTPFFIYYSMALCHAPFSPTPDNAKFDSWNSDHDNTDSSFFPSMVKYMDKKIGEVIAKVKDLGIEKNTVILYLGDNGTPNEITSQFRQIEIQGGKGETTEYGTHVPLIAYCPGLIQAGTVNNELVSFPDFLPTLANLAGIKVPSYFGTTDGVSFYPSLEGEESNSRDWIFCHYSPLHNGNNKLYRWVQNKQYKLYDFNEKFFDIQNDVMESSPLPYTILTLDELAYKNQFQSVLDSLK